MENKVKALLPSLKEKKRYIAYKVYSDKKISEDVIKKAVNSYVIKFLGELNYAKAGIMLLHQKDCNGIIKVGHNHVNETKAALALIETIDNNNVTVYTTLVSGLLNKAKEKMEVN